MTGSTLFAVGYGVAVYSAAFSDPTTYGSDKSAHYGSRGLLYVPGVGPTLFANSFCADAKKKGPASTPEGACKDNWTPYSTLPQLLGLSLVGLAFALPQQQPDSAASLRYRIILRPAPGAAHLGVAGTF